MKRLLLVFIYLPFFLSCSEKVLEFHNMDYMHSDVIPIDEPVNGGYKFHDVTEETSE